MLSTDGKTHNKTDSEKNRLQQVYKERDVRMPPTDRFRNKYHPRHPLGRLFHEHSRYILLTALNKLEIELDNMHILDVGCGHGYWLRFLVELGSSPANLVGVDLSEQRIKIAKERNPGLNWLCNDGQTLPFLSETFDITMQTAVFSSILNEKLRKMLADEMLRVTKPEGMIIWCDHRRSFSKTLTGFPKSGVVEYFHGSSVAYARYVYPFYFRLFYRQLGWLWPVIYHLTSFFCESLFLVIRKK